jgi:hypothetical protein
MSKSNYLSIQTQTATIKPVRRILRKFLRRPLIFANATNWPYIFNRWTEKGSFWLYSVLKWRDNEKNIDSVLGPRRVDTPAKKYVLEKFKEEGTDSFDYC